MSIWRDVYLAMPKGERYEFAKRTLSVPHVKVQNVYDFVLDGKGEGDELQKQPVGVVVSPWSKCCVEARDIFGMGFLALVTCARLSRAEAEALNAKGCEMAAEGCFLVALEFWFDSVVESTRAKSEINLIIALSGEGRCLVRGQDNMSPDINCFLPLWIRRDQAVADSVHNTVLCLSRVTLNAFGLAHCKNVKVEETTEPAPKCVRREGFPDAKVTYRTLAIGGSAKSARKRLEEDAEEASIQRALHICRGHFAEYGPEAPLFGKHTGQFWVPQHVRGTEKAGRVVKDYEVRKPTGDKP